MASQTGAVGDLANGGSYTPAAGSNRVVLLIGQARDDINTNTLNTLTIGGVSAHRIGGVVGPSDGGGYEYLEFWYINEADTIPSGASAVSATWAELPTTQRIALVTIQGAAQTDFATFVTETGASVTTISDSLTSLDSSVVVAAVALFYNVGNTGVTWTGYTEINDRDTGAPSQRVSAAYKNVATGTSETIAPTWSVATTGVLAALLVKDVSSSSSATVNPAQAALSLSGLLPTTSAFQSVRIREILVNGSGQAVGNATDIGLRVWYSGVCRGAPDVSLNGMTSDANGTTSWSIATGTLAYNDPIFFVAQNSVSFSHYCCGRLVPSYE
jgi:hypothetical protein